MRTDTDYGGRSLKSQMKRADKSGARYTMIIGDEELNRGAAKLRDMKESTEVEVSIEDVKQLAVTIKS